jgi:hypothetical protein
VRTALSNNISNDGIPTFWSPHFDEMESSILDKEPSSGRKSMRHPVCRTREQCASTLFLGDENRACCLYVNAALDEPISSVVQYPEAAFASCTSEDEVSYVGRTNVQNSVAFRPNRDRSFEVPCKSVYRTSERRESDCSIKARVEMIRVDEVSCPNTLGVFSGQGIDRFRNRSVAALHCEFRKAVRNWLIGREMNQMHAWPDDSWICTTSSAPSTETSLVSMEPDLVDACFTEADLPLQDMKPGTWKGGSDRLCAFARIGSPVHLPVSTECYRYNQFLVRSPDRSRLDSSR